MIHAISKTVQIEETNGKYSVQTKTGEAWKEQSTATDLQGAAIAATQLVMKEDTTAQDKAAALSKVSAFLAGPTAPPAPTAEATALKDAVMRRQMSANCPGRTPIEKAMSALACNPDFAKLDRGGQVHFASGWLAGQDPKGE